MFGLVLYGLLRFMLLFPLELWNQVSAVRIYLLRFFERIHGICFDNLHIAWVAASSYVAGQSLACLRQDLKRGIIFRDSK